MVDKIQKVLDKLSDKEKRQLKPILRDIVENRLIDTRYDIKKLAGRNDIYRIRKGQLRIIYRRDESGETYLLAIERRSDTTYNF